MNKENDDTPDLFEDTTTDDLNTSGAPAVTPIRDASTIPPIIERGPFGRMMNENFLQFASYTICDRAIPTAEDGLKPVQRRILHSLWETDDGRFTKVASVVGNAMHYHPHGDASIKDAIVTLANKRYLIEGQGNFGNILTGDSAAASRYIECRLTKLAREQIYSPKVTDYVPSYDGRAKEPVLLPAKIPLCLMLGIKGIAVGLSTEILPHNFIELLQAEINLLQHKPFELYPDFITGSLMDVSEYDDGRGAVKVRSIIEERPGEKNKLYITSLPYGCTTDTLTESIEKGVKLKKLPIKHIDNFTSSTVEIVLTLQPGTDVEKLRKALYAFTLCQQRLSSRITVLNHNRPCDLSVTEVLQRNVEILLDIFKHEFEVRQAEINQLIARKTLESIFIEKRIYKRIEEVKTADAIAVAIRTGFEPYKKLLAGPISDEDIETLLKVPIRRISLYDINKHIEEMNALRAEYGEITENLAHLSRYAIKYLKGLIKEYADEYPRLTQIKTFSEIDERALTSTEYTIKFSEDHYIGYDIKQGEALYHCSSLDKLYVVWSDGRYRFIAPPDKFLVDAVHESQRSWLNALRPRAPIQYFDTGIYQRDDEFTCVYFEPTYGFSYIKRFTWGGMILNKDYRLIPEGCTLLLFCKGTPESIYVRFVKMSKTQRIMQQRFTPSEARLLSANGKGVQMTPKTIDAISIDKPQWWNDSDGDTKGALYL